MYNYMYNFLL